MNISEETMDRIFKEVMNEYKKLKEKETGKKVTFDSLEGSIFQLGQEFERRVMEAAIEEESKNIEVKKNAQNVKAY